MDQLNLWQLLAGLGLFLFGIAQLEDAIKSLAGKAFRSWIRRYTATTPRAIFTGTIATAVLQSSSAVTLMILAFVGAGMIQLPQAIGVVLGANLGTTITSWIVASVGFKVSIEALAMPFIALGGLLMIFLQEKPKIALYGKLLFGFGLLFLGLDYMKESIDDAATKFDFTPYREYNRFFFFGAGILITALVQSSSATMAIVLTGLFSGILTFYGAAAMAIGAKVGTTITVMLGTIGGTTAKKQVGLSHVLFNFFNGIVALLLLDALVWLVFDFWKLQNDPLIGLAAFHTLFSFIGVLLFAPFTGLLAKLLLRWLPNEEISMSRYLAQLPEQLVPEATLVKVQKEVRRVFLMMMHHNLTQFDLAAKGLLPENYWKKEKIPFDKQYPTMKAIQGEVVALISRLQMDGMDPEESQYAQRLRDSLKYSVAAAKTLKDVQRDILIIQQCEKSWVAEIFEERRTWLSDFYKRLETIRNEPLEKMVVVGLHELLERLMRQDQEFMTRLNQGIGRQKPDPVLVSALLNINRAFVIGGRQSILSLNELRLPAEQSEILTGLNPVS
jgi:phosphate:Na+ symporter